MFKRYGFLGSIKIIISYIYTKLFFPQARLIRLPFDIRNKRNIKIGKEFTTGFGCRIEAYPSEIPDKICIEIGDNVQINDYVHISGMNNVRIGNNVLMASKIFISDLNHGSYNENADCDSPLTPPNERKLVSSPVIIEDNVWIGEFVSILPGVTIGKGSIIGTMSVVTRSIPPYSIAVGTPAKVIKKYNFSKCFWEKEANPMQ